MKNKFITVITLILLFTSIFVVPVSAAQHTSVTVDGRLLQFDVPPTIIEGRTMVPLRGIFEALGAQIQWDNETRTVTGVKGDIVVVLQIGSRFPTVNGVPVAIDVPGTLVDGRTMVPARFIAESLNANVDWISETRTVVIASQAGQPIGVVPPVETPAPAPEPVPEPETTSATATNVGSYIGNVNSKALHVPSCGRLPNEENRIYFDTRQEAIDLNFNPCGFCKP